MPKVAPLAKREASSDVAKFYTEIEASFGILPNLFQTAGHFLPLLETSWASVKSIMLTQRNLSRKVKETIAVLVSRDNSCQYCVGAHSMMLKAIGVTDSELDHIQSNALDQAGFNPKEILLISLARAANSDPRNIRNSLFDELNEAGATDAEIVEALGVMGIFTSFNKFIDALGVTPEQ